MRLLIALVLLSIAAGCASFKLREWDQRYGKADPERFDHPLPVSGPLEYRRDIKPILDKRCVVCHACYDAPCQLQLGSYEGITRGANKTKVYDAARLLAADPSRLFQDGRSNGEWRSKGFAPVLNERDPSPRANLEGGVLARLLRLKAGQAFPRGGLLPKERYDFSLDRDQQCPAIEELDKFQAAHPEWGMPYGLPPLSGRESRTILLWLEAGAPALPVPPPAPEQLAHVAEWEDFLNGPSLKTQLMSRYLYEHWFLAHLYFDDLPAGPYFELVRSRTPPGRPIDLISTRRPFDDPGVPRVYYRLRPHLSTLVAKTHMPYALNAGRMNRIRQWFLDEPYGVTALPSYAPEVASNPFIAFQPIPVNSRYRLLLDEAQFTVMGFIKGPVCRGQVALNVITDYFWIGFVDPDSPLARENAWFLAKALQHVRLPVEQQATARLYKWLSYSAEESEYLRLKSQLLTQMFEGPSRPDLSLLWDGDGTNPNAALTVFRHFDSASVVKGLIGERPQTALVIGYPLLERIHYLLVAGFDVFGNIAHQLEARLYMDFLRMEGELNFLTLLPRSQRNAVRDLWYREAGEDVKAYLNGSKAYFDQETKVDYVTADPLSELYARWKARLAPVAEHRLDLPEDGGDGEETALLVKLAQLRGRPVSLLPESSLLIVRSRDGNARHYTLIRNSAHSNISELFSEDSRRLPEEDSLTVVRGFVGAYPNAFYRVPGQGLRTFVEQTGRLSSEQDYAALAARYAVRRTDPGFWAFSDVLQEAYGRAAPVEGALLDYNRLDNR